MTLSQLIIGANGGVGKHLVNKLKAQNVEFTAGVRKESQVDALKNDNVSAIYVDVENQSIDELSETFKNFDQILFSVGSGPNTDDDKTIIVDLDGAVKAIKASEQAGVKHFIMVSTFDSRREAFDESGDLKPYTIAKHYADDYLRRTNLKYTIVHPGGLTNDKGTSKFTIASNVRGKGPIKITREDVAEVLAEVVVNDALHGKEFQIINGDASLSDAVAKFLEEK